MPWKSKAQAHYICMKGKNDPKMKKMCKEFWIHTSKKQWGSLPEKQANYVALLRTIKGLINAN